jgi:hypothetical protein
VWNTCRSYKILKAVNVPAIFDERKISCNEQEISCFVLLFIKTFSTMKTHFYTRPLIEKLFGGNRFFFLSTVTLWILLDGFAGIYVLQNGFN